MGRRLTHRPRWVLALVVCLSSVLMLVWSPWLTSDRAVNIVKIAFETKWRGVADGCGFSGLGIRSVQRTLLGYTVTIEYACGMLPSNSPQFNQQADVYVSPLATVHGLP